MKQASITSTPPLYLEGLVNIALGTCFLLIATGYLRLTALSTNVKRLIGNRSEYETTSQEMIQTLYHWPMGSKSIPVAEHLLFAGPTLSQETNTLLTVIHEMKKVVNNKYREVGGTDGRYSCSTVVN